ncbi:Solute:Na+ symporter, SSS family [Luteimonas sp. 9C]|uniref:sodium:solute symporter family transporter n=1 Tax=Luteimonas sp. 9C TaxID=2653148 RepID=UPI0012F333FB|nr:sodium/solute symporter [Luteimonas sp. 9C]VXA98310.1 Solute:Na+ symporter, SSS family [Luteimonas sp. 9C]
MGQLTTVDFWVIGAYFLLTAIMGFSATRRHATSDELFLAGRSLGPIAVGVSLFASNISSDTLIGLPGAAYATGISAANYEWMAGLVLIVAAIFVMPVLLRLRIATMPELMERRFDPRMRKYLSVVTLFLSLVLDTAGTLYAGGLVVTTFVPDLELWAVCLGIALFTALYTACGGLRAAVHTDLLQGTVLLVGAAALSLMVFAQFDYSWANVVARVDPDKLSLIRPLDDPGLPWLGLITGVPIVGFYYWTMNQYVVQRVLAARNIEAASRGAVIAAFLKLLPIFLMTIPGAMATVLLPDLERPDQAFPAMVTTFAPVGLAGLIIAGLVSALMSTLSSTLNASATLLTLDFVQPYRPHWRSSQLAWTGRIATLVIALLAAAWAPMIQHFSGLWSYLQQVFAFVASPLVATFLMGLWVPRLGASAALRGLACGHALSAALFVVYETVGLGMHFSIIGGVLFAATAAFTAFWMWQLQGRDRTGRDAGEILSLARPGLVHLPRDVRVGIVLVLGLTAAILVVLR